MNACPSHFALDDRELHGSADVDRHVAGCARCQGRLAERAAAAAQFEQTLAAPVWRGAVARRDEVARRPSPTSRLRLWLVPSLAAGGAVALLALVRPSPPSPSPSSSPSSLSPLAAPGYVAPKGRAPVAIVCRRGDRTFFLAPGDDVAPGDELRFRPLPVWPDARFIQIGSVDGTGGYAPFYPLAGGGDAVSVALPSPGQPLPGSIRLDDAPGPERIFVVLSAVPLSVGDVRGIAESHAAGQGAVERIAGAPVASAWIVLGKTRPGAAKP